MDLMICYGIGVLIGLIVGVGAYRVYLSNHVAGTLYLFDLEDDPESMDIYAEFQEDPKKFIGVSFVQMKVSRKHSQK